MLGKRKQRTDNDTEICVEPCLKYPRKQSGDFISKIPLVDNWAECDKGKVKEIYTQTQINMKSDIGLAIPTNLHNSPVVNKYQSRITYGTPNAHKNCLNIY